MLLQPSITHSSPVASPFDVVAIAASWGGIAALSKLLALLPADFPVPIVIVQHLSPHYPSRLDIVLARHSRLSVMWAAHDMPLLPHTVVVAPPDWHVRLTSAYTLVLTQDPKVNWTRPAADPLFESVAATCEARAIGVVLTGLGRDGMEGARAIKAAGGRILVQDPNEAEEASMPQAALTLDCVDFALPLTVIANALVSLSMVPGAAGLFRVENRRPEHPDRLTV